MTSADLAVRKNEIRRAAHAARRRQPDKDTVSTRITDRVVELAEYAISRTVMVYIDVRDEVRTRHLLSAGIDSGRRIVVPFCDADELLLYHLESMDELEQGAFGVLEPRTQLRHAAAKRVTPPELDLILVPGVAFDPQGGRTGHGKGYYDKLLQHARHETPLVALAFECQIFDCVPMQPHDIYMDMVVTEHCVYRGRGRADLSR